MTDAHAQGRLAERLVGEYMVITDATAEAPAGAAINFWDAIDDATVRAGLSPIRSGVRGMIRLPYWGFLLPLAWMGVAFTALSGTILKLTPFACRMVVIHRYFDIGKARALLGYVPCVAFAEGWPAAVDAARERCEQKGSWD